MTRSSKFLTFAVTSLFLHLIAVVKSVGFQHWDEHFQVIEFVAYKMGKCSASDMAAWEFGSGIRSWVQPAFYFILVKISALFGIHSPSSLAIIFRLASSLIGWSAIIALLAYGCRNWLKTPRSQAIAIVTTALFWFFPYFHARTSSENLSTSVFIFGLILYLSSHKEISPFRLFASGLLLGLSFELRFQTLIAIGALFLWSIAIQRISLRKWFLPIVGIILVEVCSALINFWGYGKWTWVQWNYFRENILEGKASAFGTQPLWGYFREAVINTPPLIGPLIIAVCFLVWYFRPKHVLTWITLSFFLIHSLIPHKEFRFLYPLSDFLPIFLALAFETLSEQTIHHPLFKGALGCVIAIDLIALGFATFSAARNPFQMIGYISQKYENQFELYGETSDPFRDVGYLNFYRPWRYSYHPITSETQIIDEIKGHSPLYLFQVQPTLFLKYPDLRKTCALEFRTIPKWVESLNWNHWIERAANWSLYRCAGS